MAASASGIVASVAANDTNRMLLENEVTIDGAEHIENCFKLMIGSCIKYTRKHRRKGMTYCIMMVTNSTQRCAVFVINL